VCVCVRVEGGVVQWVGLYMTCVQKYKVIIPTTGCKPRVDCLSDSCSLLSWLKTCYMHC